MTKMDCYKVKKDCLVASGKYLLRTLQNKKTNTLDLFIREGIQNSLDACANTKDDVSVDISEIQFRTQDIAEFFAPAIDLNKVYANESRSTAYVLRDSNTTGLTGPVRFSDVADDAESMGNLLKLVFLIGEQQTNKGAGGSHGCGKTIYARMGIGLVLYYTRIKLGVDHYESRLAAALFEDNNKPNSLLGSNNGSNGVAFWGKDDPLTPGRVIPITDEGDIRAILNAFRVQPYKYHETGTCIIIPYVNEKKFKTEIASDDENLSGHPIFTDPMEYMKLAIQKWYQLRLDRNCKDKENLPVLKASINGEAVEPLTFFRNLSALAYGEAIEGVEVHDDPVQLRKLRAGKYTTAGHFRYAKFTAAQLGLEAPDNEISPYEYLSEQKNETGLYKPIVCYTRKPRMIVSYETENSKWTTTMPRTDITSEIIVGVFMGNPDMNTIIDVYDDVTGNKICMEEYFRSCELADHMEWQETGNDIVSKIRAKCVSSIRASFDKVEEHEQTEINKTLGAQLASKFMPPFGFGSSFDRGVGGLKGKNGGVSGEAGSGSGGTVHGSKKHVQLYLLEPEFNGSSITLKAEIRMNSFLAGGVVLSTVTGDNSDKDAFYWESNLKTAFPVMFKSFRCDEIQNIIDGDKVTVMSSPVTITTSQRKILSDCTMSFVSTPKGSAFGFNVKFNKKGNYVIKGEFTYSINNAKAKIKPVDEGVSYGKDN